MSCELPYPYGKCQQQIDLPNLGVDHLVLDYMFCDLTFEIGCMVHGHLQGALKHCRRSNILYLEAKLNQESLVAAQEKDMKWLNQPYDEESPVGWAVFNTRLALSWNSCWKSVRFVLSPNWCPVTHHYKFWQASITWKVHWWITYIYIITMTS